MYLPYGAVAWSVVCDCGISWLYSFSFCMFSEALKRVLESNEKWAYIAAEQGNKLLILKNAKANTLFGERAS